MAALSSITRTRCMRESASPDIGRLRRGERQRQGEGGALTRAGALRSEEHTSELQSRSDLVCRLLLEKKKKQIKNSSLLLTPERALRDARIVQSRPPYQPVSWDPGECGSRLAMMTRESSDPLETRSSA